MTAGLRYDPNGDRAYRVYAEARYLGEVHCERRNHSDKWYAYLPGGGEPIAACLALDKASAALVAAAEAEEGNWPEAWARTGGTQDGPAHEAGRPTARSVTPGYDGPEGTPWGDEYHPGKARSENDA